MSRATQTIFAMAGVVLPFAGAAAPNGWLLCYGQAVSRTTYAHLFTVIGTAHGAGDGSTTFNLPDLRGRIPAGKDNMGGTAASRLTTAGAGIDGATLGASGGAQTHTLTTAQMPAHTHNQVAANASAGASGLPVMSNSMSTNTGLAGAVQAEGGGTAHNNTQPTIVLNHIIKF